MEDLLKEEEFTIPEYNPWKLFIVYYVIAVLQVITLYFYNKHVTALADADAVTIALLMLVMPIATCLIMFFCKAANKYLPLKTLILSCSILMGAYLLSYIAIALLINKVDDFFSERSLEPVLVCTGIFLFCLVVCLLVILPVAILSQRQK